MTESMAPHPERTIDNIIVGDIVVSPATGKVFVNNEYQVVTNIRLNEQEYKVFERLARSAGIPVPHEKLIEASNCGTTSGLTVLISRIRKKMDNAHSDLSKKLQTTGGAYTLVA